MKGRAQANEERIHFSFLHCEAMHIQFTRESVLFQPCRGWFGLVADEGRGKLRKASARRKQPLNRRCPNYSVRSRNAVKGNISVAAGKEINRDSVSKGDRKPNRVN